MTLTAVFNNYEVERVTGPRGGQKWITRTTQVVDTLHPVTVTFDITKTLYVRGRDINNKYQTLYNADGTFAKGIWQHGRYGSKMHTEGIELHNGVICATSSYASGQIKDQHKYLKSIDVKLK
jgi:alpha-L-fucosidase